MFKPNLLVVFNIVNELKSRAAACIAKVLLKKLRAEFISTANFMSRFIFCSECDCTIAAGTISRRLRVTLDLRVVGRLALGDGVFARAILGIITILLFGTPVNSAVYTSRLT